MQTEPDRIIRRDDDGIPWIVGTNTKVVELVSHVQTYGGDPEEVHRQLPHLSVDQVEEGLRFYRAHRTEIDADLDRRLALAETLRRAMPEAPVVKRLREESGRDPVG